MAEPIKYDSPLSGAGLLESLLGRSGNTRTTGQQVQQQALVGTTGAQSTGTQGSASQTTNTAELDPLRGVYNAGMAGMSPEMLQTLISSIFTEGATQVPALIGAYANASGARASRNSGLQLALGELNRHLSSQAASQLLSYNQAGQAQAGQAAAQIAANTRATNTAQQQQTAANSTQQQAQTTTGATNSTQQQQQRQSVNPSMAALLGLGGPALNFLDKKGAFSNLFGNTAAAAGTAPAGITSAVGAAPPLYGSAAGAMPFAGAPSYLSNTPAASSGLLPTTSYGTPAVAANTPSYLSGAGGLGGLGGAAAQAAPQLAAAMMPLGITDAVGAAAPVWGGGTGIGATQLGGATDYFGTGNYWGGSNPDLFGTASTASLGSNLPVLSDGYNIADVPGGITTIMSGAAGGTPDVVGAAAGSGDWLSGVGDWFGGVGDWIGGFFADGGQVETGGSSRNRNYMGPPIRRPQSQAINYEGYAAPAPVTAIPVTTTSPAIALPVSNAFMGGGAGTPGQGGGQNALGGATPQSFLPQNRAIHADPVEQAARLAAAMVQGPQGAGNAQGESPGNPASSVSQGQAGLGPSGIGAAPSGATGAISAAVNALGMVAPGLGLALAAIAALDQAVAAANSPTSDDDGPEGSVTVGAMSPSADDSVAVSGVDSGIGGVGGVGGTSGPGGASEGTSAGGATGGSTSGEGGNSGGNYTDGGLVSGRGNGTSDSIKVKSKEPGGPPVAYSDGEFVMPTDVVNFYGREHLQRMIDAVHTPVNR